MLNLVAVQLPLGFNVLMISSFCHVFVSLSVCLQTEIGHHDKAVFVSLRICRQTQWPHF